MILIFLKNLEFETNLGQKLLLEKKLSSIVSIYIGTVISWVTLYMICIPRVVNDVGQTFCFPFKVAIFIINIELKIKNSIWRIIENIKFKYLLVQTQGGYKKFKFLKNVEIYKKKIVKFKKYVEICENFVLNF